MGKIFSKLCFRRCRYSERNANMATLWGGPGWRRSPLFPPISVLLKAAHTTCRNCAPELVISYLRPLLPSVPRVFHLCASPTSLAHRLSASAFESMLFSRPIRLSWTSLRSLRPLQPSRFFSISNSRHTVDMGTVDTSARLAQLRQLMQEHKVDVYSMQLSPDFFSVKTELGSNPT